MFVHTRSSAPKRSAKFGWQTRTFRHKKVGKVIAKSSQTDYIQISGFVKICVNCAFETGRPLEVFEKRNVFSVPRFYDVPPHIMTKAVESNVNVNKPKPTQKDVFVFESLQVSHHSRMEWQGSWGKGCVVPV